MCSKIVVMVAQLWIYWKSLRSTHLDVNWIACELYVNKVLKNKKIGSESHSVVSDSLQPHGLYSPWNSQGQNTGGGSLSLLQGIFPTQGSNPGLLHCRCILYHLSHQGSPNIIFGLMNKCTVFIFGHEERRKPNFIFCLPECTQNSLHETKENVKVIYFFRINFPKLSCLKQQRFLNSQILRAGNLGTA